MTEEKEQPAAREPEKPLPAYPVDTAPELLQPDTTERLLNAQLAEALFLIRDAGFIYRNSHLDGRDRGCFAQHAESLMLSSVKVADCIARLSGNAPPPSEKRVRYMVERVEGEGSRRKPENE